MRFLGVVVSWRQSDGQMIESVCRALDANIIVPFSFQQFSSIRDKRHHHHHGGARLTHRFGDGVDSWDEKVIFLIGLRGLSRASLGDSEQLGWRTTRGGFTGWAFFCAVGMGALDGSVGSGLASWSARELAIRNGWGSGLPGVVDLWDGFS